MICAAVETHSSAQITVETDHENKPRKSGWSRIFSAILRVLLTVGLLVLLFWQVSWRDVWRIVQSLDMTLLAVTCAMWIPTQWLQFVKWDLLASEASEHIRRSDIHRGYWVGFTLGLITPGRVGQLGRALALNNCSLPRAFGLTAVERGYTALTMNALGLLAIFVLPFLGWQAPIPIPVWIQIILAIGGVFFLFLGVFPRLMYRPLRWMAGKLPFREKLEQAVDVLQSAGPRRGITLLLLSIAALFSSLFQFVLLIRAAGIHVPLFSGMLAGLLTFFLKGALPISIGSLGVGEWSAIVCYHGLGVDSSVAVASSLLLFVINVFIPSMIGLPFIGSLRMPQFTKANAAV
jgi:uncharacterized protein (TIRG00374 family)